MNSEMKARVDSHLKTDAELVRLSQEVRASGGDPSVCDDYDIASKAESDSYAKLIEPGLTAAGWKYYDTQRAKIYRLI